MPDLASEANLDEETVHTIAPTSLPDAPAVPAVVNFRELNSAQRSLDLAVDWCVRQQERRARERGVGGVGERSSSE